MITGHIIAIGVIALVLIFIEVRIWHKKQIRKWDKEMLDHQRELGEAGMDWDVYDN